MLEKDCHELDLKLAKYLAESGENLNDNINSTTQFGDYVLQLKAQTEEEKKLESLKRKLDGLDDEMSLSKLAKAQRRINKQITDQVIIFLLLHSTFPLNDNY